MQRECDVVMFGATGFAGSLVAEVIASKKPAKWAIAGRNREKPEAPGLGVPIVVVDAKDPAASESVAKRASVNLTTGRPDPKGCRPPATAWAPPRR